MATSLRTPQHGSQHGHGDYSGAPFRWLDQFPPRVRALALAWLTTPRVWREYRAELTRLHLPTERRAAPQGETLTAAAQMTPEMTPAAWLAGVGDLLRACGMRVVVTADATGAAHYTARPVTNGDTNPTAETVEALAGASPLACASGAHVIRYRADYPWPTPPVTPKVTPVLTPALTTPTATPPATSPVGAAASGGPTFGFLRLDDLIDDAAKAHVRRALDKLLGVEEPAADAPTTDAAEEIEDEVDEIETVEMEAIQPC